MTEKGDFYRVRSGDKLRIVSVEAVADGLSADALDFLRGRRWSGRGFLECTKKKLAVRDRETGYPRLLPMGRALVRWLGESGT